ncbi:MAG: TolC family protein [Methylococcales bacterium]|nr:TolC family protein [Methylococcales bacterium]
MKIWKNVLLLSFLANLVCRPAVCDEIANGGLTLKAVQELALKNHPHIGAVQSEAQAARESVTRARSAYFPHIEANITAVGATKNAWLASGFLLTQSTVNSRAATGLTVEQLITDFGRTATLVESSELKAEAGEQSLQAARLQTLLQATQAYFKVLRAQEVLKVMDDTVATRQAELTQIEALSRGGLKSTLDVSFAKGNLGEAKIQRRKAQNDQQAAQADLAVALGSQENNDIRVFQDPVSAESLPNLDEEIDQALTIRPDLRAVRLEHSAAVKFAEAEAKLYRPRIRLIGTVNAAPWIQSTNNFTTYNAIGGVIISTPIFDGFEIAARRDEAKAKALAAGYNLTDAENQVLRNVRVAWLSANTALAQMEPAKALLEQAKQTLSLAKSRYELGLGSIVELSQSQLNLTRAAIGEADARIEYQLRRLELDYQVGKIQQDFLAFGEEES